MLPKRASMTYHVDGLDVSHGAVDSGGDDALGGTRTQGVGESDILGGSHSVVLSRDTVATSSSSSRGGDGGAAGDTSAEGNGHRSDRGSTNNSSRAGAAGVVTTDDGGASSDSGGGAGGSAGSNGSAGVLGSRVDGDDGGRHSLVVVATRVEVHLARMETVVVGLTDGGESTQQGDGNLGSKLHREGLMVEVRRSPSRWERYSVLGLFGRDCGGSFPTKVRCEIYSQVNQSKVERVTGRKKEGRNVLAERG